jgi:hypothetical protein
MIIRTDQSAYLGKLTFIRRIRELICEQFQEARSIPRHEFNPEIFRQLKRAEKYGLQSEHGAATYVMTAWLLGPQFDEKFPAAQERLKDPETPEAQKVLWLQTFSVNLLDALQKTGNGV